MISRASKPNKLQCSSQGHNSGQYNKSSQTNKFSKDSKFNNLSRDSRDSKDNALVHHRPKPNSPEP